MQTVFSPNIVLRQSDAKFPFTDSFFFLSRVPGRVESRIMELPSGGKRGTRLSDLHRGEKRDTPPLDFPLDIARGSQITGHTRRDAWKALNICWLPGNGRQGKERDAEIGDTCYGSCCGHAAVAAASTQAITLPSITHAYTRAHTHTN